MAFLLKIFYMENFSQPKSEDTSVINKTVVEENFDEEYTPKLFSEELNQSNTEDQDLKNENTSDKLFDQEDGEDEDFEIPAFLRRQSLMIEFKINENSKVITGIFTFSSNVE